MRRKILTVLIVLVLTAGSIIGVYAVSTESDYTGLTYSHNDRFDNAKIINGIDVSQYQNDIDWEKVKADGIDFAIIRVGGRGYSERLF